MPAEPAAAALTATDITIRFGGLTAVDNVSFTIPQGGVVSLIGPNGAGKTTFFNVLTGLYAPTLGVVRLGDRDITAMPPHKIASWGMARTFQNIRLFNLMTAEENVMVAMHSHLNSGLLSTVFGMPWQRKEEREARDFARELLDFVGIGGTADDYARNLSYGDQRRLEIARAMATGPKLLCLDEPAAGFNPAEKARLMDLIRKVRDEGFTVLLIEHDMRLVMGVTDRIVVLEFGRKIAEGTPAEIRDNPAVIAAYLGVEEDDAS